MLHVALYHPAIPQNTGNIGRLCVGMDAHLHIIEPAKFDFSDNSLKRAGLDYWTDVKLTIHESEDSLSRMAGREETLAHHEVRRFAFRSGGVSG